MNEGRVGDEGTRLNQDRFRIVKKKNPHPVGEPFYHGQASVAITLHFVTLVCTNIFDLHKKLVFTGIPKQNSVYRRKLRWERGGHHQKR